jgi:hypothetical protein
MNITRYVPEIAAEPATQNAFAWDNFACIDSLAGDVCSPSERGSQKRVWPCL